MNGTLAITPAPLTVQANNATKVYGQTAILAPTDFTTPVAPQNGETVGSVTETSAGTAATAAVPGPYAITPSGASGGTFNPANYVITYVNGALAVTPAPLTVQANNATKVYGQTAVLAPTDFTTPVAPQNGETVGSVTETSAGTVATAAVPGPYAITPSGASGGTFNPANYVITYVNGALAVTPASLTVQANNATKVYGQTAVLAPTDFTTPVAPQNGETVGSVTETSPGTVATAAVPGPYAITPSGASGGTFNPANYVITYVNGALAVTPAPLTVQANNATKVYGQTAVLAPTDFTTPVAPQNGETVGSVTETSAGTVATAAVPGPYAITPSGASGGTFNPSNYTITYVNGALAVTPAPLTVQANNATKVYGQTAVLAPTDFTTPVVPQNGETVGSVTETSAGTVATAAVPGPYAITPSGASGGTFNPSNYTITYLNGTLAITPAPLTVQANNATKVYGQTAILAPTDFTTPVAPQNGETVGSVTETSAGTVATAAVPGPYAITPSSASGGTFNPSNYVITYVNGALAITPAPLTVQANNATKVYGQTAVLAPTDFTTPVAPQNGETVGSVTETSAGTVATAAVPGPYAITPSGASGGTFNPANYVITYVNGALAVTPAPLTVQANNATKVYGQTAVLAPTDFTTPVAPQNGETVGSVTETSAGTVATAAVPGPYAITPSGASGGTFNPSNYTITYVNGALAVTPAPLTVQANNATKVYGQTAVLAPTDFTTPVAPQNGETVGSVTETSAGTVATAAVPGPMRSRPAALVAAPSTRQITPSLM